MASLTGANIVNKLQRAFLIYQCLKNKPGYRPHIQDATSIQYACSWYSITRPDSFLTAAWTNERILHYCCKYERRMGWPKIMDWAMKSKVVEKYNLRVRTLDWPCQLNIIWINSSPYLVSNRSPKRNQPCIFGWSDKTCDLFSKLAEDTLCVPPATYSSTPPNEFHHRRADHDTHKLWSMAFQLSRSKCSSSKNELLCVHDRIVWSRQKFKFKLNQSCNDYISWTLHAS